MEPVIVAAENNFARYDLASIGSGAAGFGAVTSAYNDHKKHGELRAMHAAPTPLP